MMRLPFLAFFMWSIIGHLIVKHGDMTSVYVVALATKYCEMRIVSVY